MIKKIAAHAIGGDVIASETGEFRPTNAGNPLKSIRGNDLRAD